MDLSKVAEILALIADLQTKLADVEAFVAAEKAASYELGKTQGFEEGKTAGYAIGFADGVASVPVVTPGGFTQEQVDALIAEAVDPLKKSLAEKDLEIATLKESVAVEVSTQVQLALTALKAELLAKYEAQQAEESAKEAEFKASLG